MAIEFYSGNLLLLGKDLQIARTLTIPAFLIKQRPVDTEAEGTLHTQIARGHVVTKPAQAFVDVRHFEQNPHPLDPQAGEGIGHQVAIDQKIIL